MMRNYQKLDYIEYRFRNVLGMGSPRLGPLKIYTIEKKYTDFYGGGLLSYQIILDNISIEEHLMEVFRFLGDLKIIVDKYNRQPDLFTGCEPYTAYLKELILKVLQTLDSQYSIYVSSPDTNIQLIEMLSYKIDSIDEKIHWFKNLLKID